MESYQIVVVALIVLAVADLIVGVSNDAVNFLNSAIGSKVAGRKTILLVAAAGVLLGALSSSGMMEIARKGIFNPALFSFSDVMVIFVAVMVADILLLDIFNSLGLPTSTTVSIVFDLLGAAVAVALWKSMGQSELGFSLAEAINTNTALAIISGIFLSVGIAFTIGALVQYLSRLWFSFQYNRYLKTHGVVFASIAITIIIYFLLIKGAKGSALLSDNITAYLSQNTAVLLLTIFGVALVIVGILVRGFKLHPLKMVVFAGTFSLAMAFAGNDLVNFIGVPLAGLQSFQIWQESGLGADSFLMDQLGEAVRTPFAFLLIAGVIMVVTLWFSGKAQKVTETEVNLGRQDAGDERFKPNFLSRSIVGVALAIGRVINKSLPDSLIRRMGVRFQQKAEEEIAADRPAFDLVRASINLIIASLLIALATSYKLPLSTTYVSFMVAMGTSLADQAWGRESAVFRVAGVLNVVGGWLMTALMAFFTAGLLASMIYFGGPWVAIGLSLVALVFFVNSNIRFNRKEKQKALEEAGVNNVKDHSGLLRVLGLELSQMISHDAAILKGLFSYLKGGEGMAVKDMQLHWKDFNAAVERLKKLVDRHAAVVNEGDQQQELSLIYNQHHIEDLKMNLRNLVERIATHEKNHQLLPDQQLLKSLIALENPCISFTETMGANLLSESGPDLNNFREVKLNLQVTLEEVLTEVLSTSAQSQMSNSQANLLSESLLILRNSVAIKARLLKNYHWALELEKPVLEDIV